MTINRIVILVLLATVAVAPAGCGGSGSKSSAQSQQEQQPNSAPSVADVAACLKQSDVGSLITDVTLEPDPLDNNNSDVLRIETTVAPGQYEGDQGAIAVS